MSKEDGGPAFPVEIRNTTEETFTGCLGEEVKPNSFSIYTGVSVRDYFAAKALAAMIGQPRKEPENCGGKAVPKLASWAYEYADAMLAARVKP